MFAFNQVIAFLFFLCYNIEHYKKLKITALVFYGLFSRVFFFNQLNVKWNKSWDVNFFMFPICQYNGTLEKFM